RPAAPSAGGTAPSRPAAATPSPSASPAPGQGTQAPVPSAPDKRPSGRTGVLGSDDHGDGIRLVPGSDN
ncbi:MAG: hypothetical protein ACRDP5_10995, partial [Streptosporangiaceae bacterium]